MWSLVTETKVSTDNRTENLPMTVDAQYHVGFSWERQPSIRLQQKFGGIYTAARFGRTGADYLLGDERECELLHWQCRYRWWSV